MNHETSIVHSSDDYDPRFDKMNDLNELKRLLAAATPGPWHYQDGLTWHGIWAKRRGIAEQMTYHDAKLTVAVVNALSDLIAEIERLREYNTGLKEGIAENAIDIGNQLRERDARIERFEAALREIDDDPETPLWIHHRARAAWESKP